MRMPFGQNFLIDQSIAERIAEVAEISSDDLVVEIGPGKGILTRELLPLARKVTAVEIDTKLYNALYRELKKSEKLDLVNCDFLQYELPHEKYKVAANLPYNISTRIIEILLLDPHLITAAVMVQKEVASRICAKPSTSDYGYFSVLCRYYCEPQIALKVPPEAFSPMPKVHSAVVFLKRKSEVPAPDPAFFFVVKKAFAQKRKQLANSLSAGLNIDKAEVIKVIADMGFAPTIRAEELTINDFISLTSNLRKYIMVTE